MHEFSLLSRLRRVVAYSDLRNLLGDLTRRCTLGILFVAPSRCARPEPAAPCVLVIMVALTASVRMKREDRRENDSRLRILLAKTRFPHATSQLNVHHWRAMLHHHDIRSMGDRLSTARDLCIASNYDKGIGLYQDVLTQLKPAIKRVSQARERQDWLQVQSDLESELGAMMDYAEALHSLKLNAPGQNGRRPRSSTPSDRPKSGDRWQIVDGKREHDQPDREVWAPPSPDSGRGGRRGVAPNWADKQKNNNNGRVKATPPARLANRAEKGNYVDNRKQPAAVNGRGGPTPRKAPTGQQVTPSKDKVKKTPDGEKPKYSELARENGWCDVELIEGIERDIVDTGPKITFDDIAGLEHTKELLQEAVMLPQIAPHLFKDGRLKPCNGVLMFGPPGTGKTLLAKAVANVCNSTFFNVSASTLASKYRGESEKMVRILFEMARYYSPAIIFMDEIDAIAGARGGAEEHESSRRVKTELLVQINGVGSGEKSDVENNRVMVLAATNLPWQIDEAMRRRLTKRVYIPLPDIHGRRALFNLNLKRVDVAPDVDYDRLATQTEGYSGDDICGVCETAKMFPVKRLYTPEFMKELALKKTQGFGEDEIKAMEKNGLVVTMNDIVMALENVSKSVGQDQLVRFQKWEEEFGSR
ncbi:hypothetical protein H310_03992 [Aphanomyces invadans]|uniref:Katanin p60 ATPase-containing subunit A1 n=1 Tax=Aphanomyces invadans TaxID=157072 RepID=A0A024UER6_9STRA|nr:hypothetical protein H310_03992 [Aphanomyces invadans]ETW04881.1 hypothetical protein H310_03992 [Aphanomyces invadans]|eukprot:XP_008866319.1 hypothetical protein H310_03992 [Aphanomyces invadans]